MSTLRLKGGEARLPPPYAIFPLNWGFPLAAPRVADHTKSMKAHKNGVAHSYLTPRGLAWPTSLLALFLVFLVGLAPDAVAQDITRYEFPFLSNSLEQAKVLANAFGTQMLLFTSAVGAGMPAFTYLAAFATMVGALVLVFMRQFQPTVVFTWLLTVGIVLFVPLNSRLLFTPINLQQNNQQFIASTQSGVASDSVLQLPVFSRFTHDGTACAAEPMGCGFTPQLVAVHLASTFQLIFSDLFRSTEWSGLLERADADNKLRSQVAFNLGDTWLREAEHFRNSCRNTDVLGDYVARRLTPARIAEINRSTSPMTFGDYWDLIRNVYAPSLDHSRKPPIAVLPETLEQAQNAGWGEDPDGETYQRYYSALMLLYKNYKPDTTTEAVNFTPSDGVVTPREVLDEMTDAGFFAGTVFGGSRYFRDGVISENIGSVPTEDELVSDQDLRANIGFFVGKYSQVIEDPEGGEAALRRMCFRNGYEAFGRTVVQGLTGGGAEQSARDEFEECAKNYGYPANYMKTFNLIDEVTTQGFGKLEKVSQDTLLSHPHWRLFMEPSSLSTLRNMPIITGLPASMPVSIGSVWGGADFTIGSGASGVAFTPAANAYQDETCRIMGARQLDTVIHVLDDARNDRGGTQSDGLFAPLVGLLDANDLGRPDGGGGGGVIPDRLDFDDIVSLSAVELESMDALKMADQARYKFVVMLRDDLNETLRRVQGRGDIIKRAALVYRMMELAQTVTMQQNPNAITSAMTAANEDGRTPRIVGSQLFTNAYGELGSQITEEVLTWYVLIIGPVSYMTIHFLTIMIDLSLYALIALTPFLLLIGIMAPKRAMGILVITVLPVFVLKFVPVTLILLNNIAGMVYDLLPGAMGGNGEVAQAMLIMGMASMYTALIGLTMYLLFKFGDAGAFMGGLTGLDKAAQEAAQTANTIMRGLATAALAIAVGGPAALAGGMSWSKIKKNWGAGKGGKGGTEGTDPDKPKTPQGDGSGDGAVSDAALKGVGEAIGQANLNGTTTDLNGKLVGEPGSNPLSQTDTALQNGAISEELHQSLNSNFENYFKNGTNEAYYGSSATRNIQLADGTTVQAIASIDENGKQSLSWSPIGTPTAAVGVPFGGGVPNPDASAGDTTTANTTNNTSANALAGGVSTNPVAGSAAPTTGVPGGTQPATTPDAAKAEPISAGAQSVLDKKPGSSAAEDANKPHESLLKRTPLEDQQVQSMIAKRTDDLMEKRKLATGGKDEKEWDANTKKTIEELDEKIKALGKISTTAVTMGDTIAALTDFDAQVLQLERRRIGADKEFTSLADAAKLYWSGTIGGTKGLMKGAGGIPIVGDLIGEVSNEWFEGAERAKAMSAAGGYLAYSQLARDAKRMKMYKEAVAPIAAGSQYQNMQELGAFQSMATNAKMDAAIQAAQARSSLDAMIAKRVVQDKALTIDQLDVKTMDARFDYTAKDFEGIGRVAAAEKLGSVWGEAAAMQGKSWKVNVWNDEKGEMEPQYIKPNASALSSIYSDMGVKKAGKYFDAAMVDWYGIKEKHTRQKSEWEGTGSMAGNKAMAARFNAEDVSDDYLVGGHNKMVEGKVQFYEMRGKHERYVTLRNDEAIRIFTEQQRIGSSEKGTQEFVDKLFSANSAKLSEDGTLVGKSKKEVMNALTNFSKGDQEAVRRLGNDFGKYLQKSIIKGLGGDAAMPLAGIMQEAFERGDFAIRTKSKIAKYNIATMEDDLANTVLKAQADAFESFKLNKDAKKNSTFRFENVDYGMQKATVKFNEKNLVNFGEQTASDLNEAVMKGLARLSPEQQMEAFQRKITDFADASNNLIGKEMSYVMSEALAKVAREEFAKMREDADEVFGKMLSDGNKFGSVRAVSGGEYTGDVYQYNSKKGSKEPIGKLFTGSIKTAEE